MPGVLVVVLVFRRLRIAPGGQAMLSPEEGAPASPFNLPLCTPMISPS